MRTGEENSSHLEKNPGELPPREAQQGGEGEVTKSQPSAEAAPATSDISLAEKALEEEKAKAQQYLANWQRAQADFSNLKRRTDQEKLDTVKFANAMLVSSLLPVLDDMERAFDSVSAKLAGLTWVDGMKLIYRKMQAILEAQGLTEIKAVGQDFDPRLHEAVLYVEGEEGKVIEEVQKGYKFHERVIRPTMVKIGKKKEESNLETQKPDALGQENQSEENKPG